VIYDDSDRERDEPAEKLRERDRHREPRQTMAKVSLVKRRVFQAPEVDRVNELASVRPHKVFVATDSSRELFDCGACGDAKGSW